MSTSAWADSEVILPAPGTYSIEFRRPMEGGCMSEYNMIKGEFMEPASPLELNFKFGEVVECSGTCPLACENGDDYGHAVVTVGEGTRVTLDGPGQIMETSKLCD